MNEKRIGVNSLPKGFRLFFLLLPLLGLFTIGRELDNDFFFLYPTGQYIIENGFPVKDFLSMHTGMNIIVQQWLTDVIFYFIYSHFGKAGMIAFLYICYILFCAVMYKLLFRISENHFISCMMALCSGFLMSFLFITTRPQSITIILIALELFALESFVKTKKTAYLFILPVISVLLINLHSSMWLMMFVFALPYAFGALKIKLKKYSQEPCCSFVKLLICGTVCFALGFANPYGIKAMTYLFSSFGIDYINSSISEMEAMSFSSFAGKLLFGVMGIMLAVFIARKKRAFTPRFVLLFVGTAVLSLMNYKSVAYFIIGGFAAFTYFIADLEPTLKITDGEKTKADKRKVLLLSCALVAALGLLAVAAVASPALSNSENEVNVTENGEEPKSTRLEDYAALDEICEILKKENGEITLYTGFNYGQYMEFKGFHPFIDGRAELFLEKNNGENDYLKEFVDLKSAKLYYKDFLGKYNFNYIIVTQKEAVLSSALEHDGDYEKLYDSVGVDLYKLK